MSELVLSGLNGANPLGFMAALGTFRMLSQRDPCTRLHWTFRTEWRPVVSCDLDRESLAAWLLDNPTAPLSSFENLGKDITVSLKKFSSFIHGVPRENISHRSEADFAASFGNELLKQEKLDRIQFTQLCFITGSGHQHFLETIKQLHQNVTAAHLEATLFEPWINSDSGFSLRWDPADAREYALRWNDPGSEGVASQWGASWLAFEALPFFPTVPTKADLETTSFRDEYPFNEFTWPIWNVPVPADTVASLLSYSNLYEKTPDREQTAAMGICEIFRSKRVRIGSGANFKVSFRPARAL